MTITAASMALADAGVAMLDLTPAVSLSLTEAAVLLDPTSEEEAGEDGSMLVAAMHERNELTQFTMTGTWTHGQVAEVAAPQFCTH
eukprot:SM000054S18081  [mRNA]  locus=s54:211839:212426:- [translate_table: standard]